MSYSVSGTMITLTRGDTFSALITITDLNDNQYIPMNCLLYTSPSPRDS